MIIGTLGDASKASVVFFFSPFQNPYKTHPLALVPLALPTYNGKVVTSPFPLTPATLTYTHIQHSRRTLFTATSRPFSSSQPKKTTQSAYAMACYGVGPWNAVAPSRCIHASIPGITSSLLAPLQPSRCGVPSPQTDVYAREEYLHSTCIRTKLIAPGPRTTPAQYLGRQVRYLCSYLV